MHTDIGNGTDFFCGETLNYSVPGHLQSSSLFYLCSSVTILLALRSFLAQQGGSNFCI